MSKYKGLFIIKSKEYQYAFIVHRTIKIIEQSIIHLKVNTARVTETKPRHDSDY